MRIALSCIRRRHTPCPLLSCNAWHPDRTCTDHPSTRARAGYLANRRGWNGLCPVPCERAPMPPRCLHHLIISREFPPAAYRAGGIGTYAAHVAGLLAAEGDTVHVIGERWAGASEEREVRSGGRLVIHRVPLDTSSGGDAHLASPARRFARSAARLAEQLVASEGIDVIEAQDWEAPLAEFLERRALGLGPAVRPPCVVHLHSPTECIARHNEWPGTAVEMGIHLEEYCILAADALLCPSRYLAREATERFALDPDAITVIPYPRGDFPPVARTPGVWARGSLVHLGRLEPRKGVLEWLEAAVSVARTTPSARFDFIGDDVSYRDFLTVRQVMQSRIPLRLWRRFRFVPRQPRDRLPVLLARARAAVVPSRWENFPNTCIEAMSSGLPVLVAPTGGMAEMVEDGVTGWVAESQAPAALEAALRRMLAVAPDRLAAMGEAAAGAIRERCDNAATIRRHRMYRAEVARRGARPAPPTFPQPPVAPRSPDGATRSDGGWVSRLLGLPLRTQLIVARDAMLHPRQTLRWIGARRAVRPR